MQETLSPAMDWLSGAQIPVDAGYSSSEGQAVFLTEEAVQVAERAARRLSPAAPTAPRRGHSRSRVTRWLALAGMAAIGLFAVMTPLSTKPVSSSARAVSGQSQPAACLWLKRAEPVANVPPIADQVIASCVACHLTMR